MKTYRFILTSLFTCAVLCSPSVAQRADRTWVDQLNPDGYVLTPEELPPGMSPLGEIKVARYPLSHGGANDASGQYVLDVRQKIEPGRDETGGIEIVVRVAQSPDEALQHARRFYGAHWESTNWMDDNDLGDPEIAAHGGSRWDIGRVTVLYRNILADFSFNNRMLDESTRESVATVARRWLEKVAAEPENLPDLVVKPEWVRLSLSGNSWLRSEKAADLHVLGVVIKNNSTTTAAKRPRLQLSVKYADQRQPQPLEAPVAFGEWGEMPPGSYRRYSVVWDLAGRNAENAVLIAQVWDADSEDANPEDNVARLPVSIYYAHNGTRAFSWRDDTYSFRNFSFKDSELEGMVEGLLATVVGNLSAEQNLAAILERLLFPQTYMRLQKYLAVSNGAGAGGHCYGMAATSALYFEDADLKPLPKGVSDLTLPEASTNIGIYHRAQVLPVVQALMSDRFLAERDFSVNATRAAITQSLRDDRQASIIEFYGSIDGKACGHAVLAYKLIDVPGRDSVVYVYDPNFPRSSVNWPKVMPQIILWADGTTWSNPQYMGYEWATATQISSRRPHRTISLAEVNAVVPELKKSLQEMTAFLHRANQFMAVLRCPADAVFTDGQGRRTGMVAGKAVNEIPRAEIRAEGEVEIYLLPANQQYSLRVTGTDTGSASLDAIRPVTATKAGLTSFQDVPITRGSTATGTVLPGGRLETLGTGGRNLIPRLNGTYEGSAVTAGKRPAPGPPDREQTTETLVLCHSTADGKPVGVATKFHDVSQLLGCYTYKERAAGNVEGVWQLNGVVVGRATQAIKAGSGSAWFGYRREGGGPLRPGTYRLDARTDGRTVLSQQAIVTCSEPTD